MVMANSKISGLTKYKGIITNVKKAKVGRPCVITTIN